MIKEIFLPSKIGKHRIYSERILGFSIQDDIVSCVQVYATRSKIFVEKTIKEKIEDGSLDTQTERTAQAIKKILANVGKYKQIWVSISSSIVVFKEMEVPFKDTDKIRMVLDYEIEPMLPFSIDEAITDFIITKYSKEENKSQILAAAVRQQDLVATLEIYRAAGIEPANISIDLFALYSLYQQIPEYQNIKNACAIIDIGSNHSRIAFLQNGELRLTRIMPRGINNILKAINSETNISIDILKENLEKFGLQEIGNSVYDKSAKQQFISFFNDIQFTLNSFSLTLNVEQGVTKILIAGPHSTLKNLAPFCKEVLQTPCEVFACEKIFLNNRYQNKIKAFSNNWTEYAYAMGTALSSDQQSEFDLRRGSFILPMQNMIKKQIIAASIIFSAIFGTLFIRGYLQIHKLSSEIEKIEKQESDKLKKLFPKDYKLPREPKFATLVKEAEKVLAEKKDMWAPFEKERMQPLLILQELTSMIDKKRFDVTIDKVSISEEKGVPTEEELGGTSVEIEGFFKSKTGVDHYKYFMELESNLSDSKILKLKASPDAKGEGDKGIRFSAKYVTATTT
jgi:type IV pilus assembly protein PilM